jgi:hypothetical protein
MLVLLDSPDGVIPQSAMRSGKGIGGKDTAIKAAESDDDETKGNGNDGDD